ncbi:MAG: regulatory protein RecX, partial [Oscillospiraceae bacterium]|nr:regulatory protein RecX [Oscillospiraceae bacterium]
MPRIIRLEASKHVKGRVLVFFQDKELVKLTEDEVLLRGLFAGQELSEEEYAALVQDGKLSSAKSAAARLCSSKLLSRGELLQKLRDKGEDPTCAQQAEHWLDELLEMEDRRYAASD